MAMVALDFGWGPGHNLVGFGVYSRPEPLIGMDVSSPSRAEAEERFRLHGIDAEFVKIDGNAAQLVLPVTCDPAGSGAVVPWLLWRSGIDGD